MIIFQDRFALDSKAPLLDPSQDFVIHGGFENETHTVVRFSRKWDTCDHENVRIIQI